MTAAEESAKSEPAVESVVPPCRNVSIDLTALIQNDLPDEPDLNRIIDSVKELDALPLGAVIQDSKGIVYRRTEGYYYDGPHDWQTFDGYFWDVVDFVMPVTLIALNAHYVSKASVPTGER